MANSRLDSALELFRVSLVKGPGTDAPINTLAEVEQIIVQDLRGITSTESEFVLDDLTMQEKADIDAVLIEKGEGSISDIARWIQVRAEDAFELGAAEGLMMENYFRRLGVLFNQDERVILRPNKQEKRSGLRSSAEYSRTLNENKIVLLMNLLYRIGIYPNKDISVSRGKNTPEMMRRGSYYYIEIPKINKTVLIHVGYKEATFIVDGIHPRDYIFNMTKDDLHDILGAKKVIYSEDDIPKWLMDMEAALTCSNGIKDVDIRQFDQMQQYLDEIRKKYPTSKDFLKLGYEDRRSFEIRGRKLASITTIICGENHGLDTHGRNEDFVVLASYIYPEDPELVKRFKNEEEKKEAGKWDKDKWMSVLKDMYPTPELFWGAFHEFARKKKLIKGQGILAIRSKILNIAYHAGLSYRDYARIGIEIYGPGYEPMDCELWGKEEWIKRIKELFPTAEEFMGIDVKILSKLSVHRFQLHQIAEKITGLNDLINQLQIYDQAFLAREVYGEEPDCIDVHFWNIERWKKEWKKLYPTPEDYMSMTIADKKAIDFYGLKITQVSSKFGMPGRLPGTNPQDFAELGQRIYGMGHKIIDHVLWSPEQWIEELRLLLPETREEFMSVSRFRNIKICGRGIKYITKKILGGKKWNPEDNKEHRSKLADAIYGCTEESQN